MTVPLTTTGTMRFSCVFSAPLPVSVRLCMIGYFPGRDGKNKEKAIKNNNIKMIFYRNGDH